MNRNTEHFKIQMIDLWEVSSMIEVCLANELLEIAPGLDHSKLLQAIKEQDIEIAEALMVDHLSHVTKYGEKINTLLAIMEPILTKPSLVNHEGKLLSFDDLYCSKGNGSRSDEPLLQRIDDFLIYTLDRVGVAMVKHLCRVFDIDDLSNAELQFTRRRHYLEVVYLGDFRINWFNEHYDKSKKEKVKDKV